VVTAALACFERAVEVNDIARVGPPAIHSRGELARTLRLLGRDDDARRAGSRAAALARRLGMRGYAQ
jgi:hypothetical protein